MQRKSPHAESPISCFQHSRHSFALTLALALASLALPLPAHADTPFIGEVVCNGYDFCPRGSLECNGQTVAINTNTSLFSLLGTTYGGSGSTTFALPDLRGRTMVGQGSGPGLSTKDLGDAAGTETVTLTTTQIPGHSHSAPAHDNTANGAALENSASPTARLAGTAPDSAKVYGASASLVPLHSSAMGLTGGGQPHNNLQPYLAMKCCIYTQGIFPSRN
jgi:microcystin-dependent protein